MRACAAVPRASVRSTPLTRLPTGTAARRHAANPALYSSVRSGAGRPSGVPAGRRHLPEEVRRSLKTQQHAHPRPTPRSRRCVQVRMPSFVSTRVGPAFGGAKTYPVRAPEPAVYLGSLV